MNKNFHKMRSGRPAGNRGARLWRAVGRVFFYRRYNDGSYGLRSHREVRPGLYAFNPGGPAAGTCRHHRPMRGRLAAPSARVGDYARLRPGGSLTGGCTRAAPPLVARRMRRPAKRARMGAPWYRFWPCLVVVWWILFYALVWMALEIKGLGG